MVSGTRRGSRSALTGPLGTGNGRARPANYRAPVAAGKAMPKLRVIDRDGVERELEASNGATLMEPLRDMEDGVAAICGGMCSCATCHVYVDEAWVSKLPAAMSDETDMLGDLSSRKPNSRLSCQIVLNDTL